MTQSDQVTGEERLPGAEAQGTGQEQIHARWGTRGKQWAVMFWCFFRYCDVHVGAEPGPV